MKLNLGEGSFPLEGFTGIDRSKGQEAYPLDFPDDSAEEIYASHLLEHFTPPEIINVLADWVRVLKPGGRIRIAVPDFARICSWYQEKQWDKPIASYLMGGQTDANDFHKSIFDAGSLRLRMEQAGLTDIQPWDAEIKDSSALEVSLNLQGTKPIKSETNWPLREAYNIYSQFGEDGILNAIFNKLDGDWHKTKGYCVDVGAADGKLFSNVRQFIEAGWQGVLIESNDKRFQKLQDDLGKLPGVRCIHEKVEPQGARSLDQILLRAGAPFEFDLLSIDVDGQDYYIWNSLLHFHPRVVVCEFNYRAEDPMFIPPLNGDGQAGYEAIAYVAAARGYVPVAKTLTNMICVRRSLMEQLGLNEAAEVPKETPIELSYDEAVAAISNAEVANDEPVRIHAVASVPRLGFNATWHCVLKALMTLHIPMQMVTGAFWGACLTRGIEQAIQAGAEFILTIDYDSVFDERHIARLCQLAMMPEYQCIDAFVPVQIKRESGGAMFQMNGERDFSKPITRILSGHFGLTLIRTEALLKMAKPWFHSRPNAAGTWTDGRVDDDMFFWAQFQRAGCTVGLANEVRIGHIEEVVTWPTESFDRLRQGMNDFREHGQPIECGGGLKIDLA